jgi:hypothetical protein
LQAIEANEKEERSRSEMKKATSLEAFDFTRRSRKVAQLPEGFASSV